MMKRNTAIKITVAALFICLHFLSPSFAVAFSGLKARVEVIKADRNSNRVDSELKDLVKDLAPVLNYSGFSLIKQAVIHLAPDNTGSVILPDHRILELQFLGFKDQQARLSVRILEKGKETFRTILLLVNKGNILIGGPPYEKGVLLLRVGGEFK